MTALEMGAQLVVGLALGLLIYAAVFLLFDWMDRRR